MALVKEQIIKELSFKTSRSGGKGGQNVNKVASKVEVIFNPNTTTIFTAEEKALVLTKLAKRLDSEGNLHIVCQEDRSQLLNKERSIVKLLQLLNRSLLVQKKRKPTKIPKAVVAKRLKDKFVKAVLKQNRKLSVEM